MYKVFFTMIGLNLLTFRMRFLFPALLWLYPLFAQDKTQYLLHEIPQTLSLNPAITYKCRNYIEIPFISQLQFQYRNSGFSHNQIFEDGKGITGDTTRIDVDGLASVLGNRNHIRLGGKVTILGFGFEADDWFFSMNVSNRSSARFSFNRDIIDARDGNWDISTQLPRNIKIDGTGIHLFNFTEFAFGAGYTISKTKSAGFRIKYLLGAAHLQTRRSDIRLLTSDSPVELTGSSDLLLRGSLPLTITQGSNGYITSVENRLNSISDLPGLLFSWNHGLAFDAGIIHAYSDKLIFSASILDLGFIRWRKNISVISQNEEFIFRGIDLNNYFQSDSETDFLRALEDSIRSTFSLSGSSSPYSAMIPVRLIAGGEYKWSEKLSVGAVVEGEVLSSRIYPSFTLAAIARPSDFLTASLSYSLMDRGFNNFGFGIVFGKGPLQLYFTSDNIPVNYVRETDLGLYWPYSARTMNLRAGVNVIFGCKDKKAHYRSLKWKKSCPAYN